VSLSRSLIGSRRSTAKVFVTVRKASRRSTVDHHGVVTASRVAYFDLFVMAALPRGPYPASNALTCPDDIFGKRRVGSVRRELLDRVLIMNERDLRSSRNATGIDRGRRGHRPPTEQEAPGHNLWPSFRHLQVGLAALRALRQFPHSSPPGVA
jgi:hypothetical protein